MNLEQIKAALRPPRPEVYPELATYSRRDIYRGKMGPGGLYLAAHMMRGMDLKRGDTVLDLGCGKGATSVFLAKAFGLRVFAVDLWISANRLHRHFDEQGISGQVLPLNLDVRGSMPFAEEYFDAIFCMDSIHYYGGSVEFMTRLVSHLKPGGILCIGSPCFNEEFTTEQLKQLPPEYDNGTDLWRAEFSLYHSPSWWRSLLEDTQAAEVVSCQELPEGVVLWEDELLYRIEEESCSAEKAGVDWSQIAYGYEHKPYLTHFVLQARRTREGERLT